MTAFIMKHLAMESVQVLILLSVKDIVRKNILLWIAMVNVSINGHLAMETVIILI
jgi:hypothetical protein